MEKINYSRAAAKVAKTEIKFLLNFGFKFRSDPNPSRIQIFRLSYLSFFDSSRSGGARFGGETNRFGGKNSGLLEL